MLLNKEFPNFSSPIFRNACRQKISIYLGHICTRRVGPDRRAGPLLWDAFLFCVHMGNPNPSNRASLISYPRSLDGCGLSPSEATLHRYLIIYLTSFNSREKNAVFHFLFPVFRQQFIPGFRCICTALLVNFVTELLASCFCRTDFGCKKTINASSISSLLRSEGHCFEGIKSR